jgi:bla regulator protein BlaR1
VINHLWQSTVFAILAAILTLAFRKNRAQVRYWLWLSASVKFLIPFSLLMSVGSNLEWAPAAQTIAMPVVSSTMVQFTQPFPEAVSFVPSTTGTLDWVPMSILGVWACGFAAIALIRFRGWLRVRGAIRASFPLEISAPVDIRSSPGLLEPGVVGFLRPVLLLPEGIAECLTPRQLEAVLAHELCHVRRRDNLTSAIHMIVEAVFWFHPFVWWIGARLVDERERACDEAVLSLGNEPQVYAEAILNVCKIYLESPLRCVSGVTGSDLKKRIQAILTGRVAGELNFLKRVALAIAGIAVLALPVLVGIMNSPAIRAQSQPAFDVASIKRSGPDTGGSGKQKSGEGDGGGRLRFTPGRVTGTKVSARRIILEAYHVTPRQLSGGPGWLDSERFDLEAKTGAAASETQIRTMLQTMLDDRFKLVLRRETKEIPVYALMVGKNGSKLREWNTNEDGIRLPLPKMARREDAVGYFMDRGKMQTFIDDLSRNPSIDRPVLDRTGLQGAYLFYLAFGPDDNMITATQDQLGLRFETQRAPMDILVIDHVEKPTEN